MPLTPEVIQSALDRKTKPPRSLGRLESLAAQIAAVQDTLTPDLTHGRVVVFAGDHGIAARGVSAYPPSVTPQMVRNFAAGGAAINALVRANGLLLEVVDVGVADALDDLDGVVHAKVRSGTRDFLEAPAMTADECAAAMAVGAAAVTRALADGVRMLGLGEMGIGNTTAAAALLAWLLDLAPDAITGRGTGVDEHGLARKREAVAQALARHRAAAASPRDALAAVGGLEIAAMTGAILAAHGTPLLIVLDGFISTAAGVVAVRCEPSVRERLVAAHRSAEQGHRLALEALSLAPVLELDMRLGEGSGAALAMPVLRAAAGMLREMATFESAGVDGPA